MIHKQPARTSAASTSDWDPTWIQLAQVCPWMHAPRKSKPLRSRAPGLKAEPFSTFPNLASLSFYACRTEVLRRVVPFQSGSVPRSHEMVTFNENPYPPPLYIHL